MKLAFTTISESILRTRTIDPRKWQGDFTYVDISSIDRETKRIVEPKTLPTNAAPSRARKELKKGDILVSTVRPNLNAVALVEQEFPKMIASTGFAVLRADPLKTLSKYLFYRCLTESFIQDMVSQAQGAGYPAVSDAIIGGHQLPLPTLYRPSPSNTASSRSSTKPTPSGSNAAKPTPFPKKSFRPFSTRCLGIQCRTLVIGRWSH